MESGDGWHSMIAEAWPRPRPRWADADIAEAWRELERLIGDGWTFDCGYSVSWWWLARHARRRIAVHSGDRDPVEAIRSLIRACEDA